MADIEQLADVHVKSWHSTYTGLTDQQFAHILTYDSAKARFIQKLEEDNVDIFVAEKETKAMIGFVIIGPQRYDVDFSGEIYALYLLEEYQGKGIGKSLFMTGVQQLKDYGYQSFSLLFIKDNKPAQSFYDYLGGHEIKRSTFDINGVTYEDIFYGWDSTEQFLKQHAHKTVMD